MAELVCFLNSTRKNISYEQVLVHVADLNALLLICDCCVIPRLKTSEKEVGNHHPVCIIM